MSWIVDRAKNYLRGWLREQPLTATRAMPGQADEGRRWLYATGPNAEEMLVQYALSTWVYVATSRLAEAAASSQLKVFSRTDATKEFPQHPLLDLIGAHGRPNDAQDSFEFWESHFSTLELAGNSYWYWSSKMGGQPDEVYLLDPRYVKVVPGTTRTIDGYLYNPYGKELRLSPEEVTHFKRYHPTNRYYGLSALEALRLELANDRSMARWNADFFGDGVALPAGIFVIPPSVSDADRDRLDADLNSKYAQRRKTAVVRAKAGDTVWHPSGLNPRDTDFANGRMLSRQAVYEALDLPLGYMSEASTEAHARVAERRFLWSVHRRHVRTCAKLNSDALLFWTGYKNREARFDDVRRDAADWQQMSMKLTALQPFMDRDEIRSRELGLPAAGKDYGNATSAGDQQQQGRGDTGAVSGGAADGQAQDEIQRDDGVRIRLVPGKTDLFLAQPDPGVGSGGDD